MMTGFDLKNRPGRRRAGPICVQRVATGDIVHEGVDPEAVDGLMGELACRLEDDEDIPIVVKAAAAHLNLALIHPFRDGNGRMARGLPTLILAREGIVSPAFSSIEEHLGRDTRGYYDVLEAVGTGSRHPENDTRPWIRDVLTGYLRQGQSDDPVSEQTATRDLAALTNRGLLVAHGERRGRFSPPVPRSPPSADE